MEKGKKGNLNLIYGYASCLKSKYFYYRYLSEDLNNPKSTEFSENRDVALNIESVVYKMSPGFLMKLLKK